jgi:hypothetical protein
VLHVVDGEDTMEMVHIFADNNGIWFLSKGSGCGVTRVKVA